MFQVVVFFLHSLWKAHPIGSYNLILIITNFFLFSEPRISRVGEPYHNPHQAHFKNKAEGKNKVIWLISDHSSLNGHKAMRAHRCPSTYLHLFNLPGKLWGQYGNLPECWPKQQYGSKICCRSILFSEELQAGRVKGQQDTAANPNKTIKPNIRANSYVSILLT